MRGPGSGIRESSIEILSVLYLASMGFAHSRLYGGFGQVIFPFIISQEGMIGINLAKVDKIVQFQAYFDTKCEKYIEYLSVYRL